MVVDGDMDELPAGAAGLCAAPVRLAGSIASDAVAGALEAAEPLDVQMQELAGPGALVAPFRLCGFEVFEARQAGAFEDAADGGGRDAEAARNVLACEAFAAQDDDLLADVPRRRLTQTASVWHSCGCSFGPSEGV